jgi:lysophospholipase L1-like esterase
MRSSPWACVLLGLIAVVVLAERSGSEASLVEAAGSFWQLVDSDGEPLQRRRGERGLGLDIDERLELLEPDGPSCSYKSLHLSAQKVSPGALLEVVLQDTGAVVQRLVLVPDETPMLFLIRTDAEGRREVLLQGAVSVLEADPFRPFRLSVTLRGSRVTAAIDGVEVLHWEGRRLAHGRVSVVARDGAMRLLKVEALGTQGDGPVGRESFGWQDGFGGLKAVSPWMSRLTSLGVGLASLLLLGAYLRSLCHGRPGLMLVTRAVMLWTAPFALLLAAQAALPVLSEAEWITPLGWALVAAAFLPAWYLLSPHVTGDAPRAGLSTALALLVIACTTGIVADAHLTAEAPRHDAEARARELPLSEAQEFEQTLLLDAHNDFTLEGPFRNFVLSANVVLEQDATLQVRLRSESLVDPHGITLVLSADPRRGVSFRSEEAWEFAPIGSGSESVPAGRAFVLQIVVDGYVFEASIDGRSVARAESREHPSGAVTLMAAPGRLRLSDLSIEARPHGAETPGRFRSVSLRGAGLIAGVVLLAIWIGRLLAMGWRLALLPLALTLVPLGAALHFKGFSGRLSSEDLAEACLAATLLGLQFVMVRARTVSSSGAVVLAGVLVVAGLPLGYSQLTLGPHAVGLSNMSYDQASGAAAHEDLLWLEQPLLRRWNDYLCRHRFGGRNFDIPKPDDTTRVISLGGSSTQGFQLPKDSRADYPSQLEQLLSDEAEFGRVEVLNAACWGAVGERQFRFLRDVLMSFEPDLVTLSLTYNDAWALSGGDEERYYERITAPGAQHTWWDDWLTRREVEAGRKRLVRLIMAREQGASRLPSLQAWDALGFGSPTPPERFEIMLERFVDFAEQQGFELVLIKEPIQADRDLLWKQEFYAVIDKVGAEHGLSVVDPRPALAAASGVETFFDEIHLSPSGHRLVAEALTPVVAELLRRRR